MYSDLLFDYITSSSIEVGKELGFRKFDLGNGVTRERYDIRSEDESLKYEKPIGRYELISIPDPLVFDDEIINYIVHKLSSLLGDMIGKIKSSDSVLIVGLGNRHISSDSLGAKVVGKINITINNKLLPKVMAISPSVMGLTGIETVDIIEGVVMKTKPSHVIIIDSLCASSSSRLGKSIQITNTGICPGGGIGNKRKCIDKNIAKYVYSVGIPLLIFANTFVKDTLISNNILEDDINDLIKYNLKIVKESKIFEILKSIKNVFNDSLDSMIVSIKDIEECVDILSTILSRAINDFLGVN